MAKRVEGKRTMPLMLSLISFFLAALHGFLILNQVYGQMPRYWVDVLYMPISIIVTLLMVVSSIRERRSHPIYFILFLLMAVMGGGAFFFIYVWVI
ncbi:hypothetical protein [Bacillus testis]|uniref:hypothetical protein n=1 Tax=Bacillus testis TaxID=1622072 RepID=UPI00067EA83A|nr:hypothetical protein [Bacillus testis]